MMCVYQTKRERERKFLDNIRRVRVRVRGEALSQLCTTGINQSVVFNKYRIAIKVVVRLVYVFKKNPLLTI